MYIDKATVLGDGLSIPVLPTLFLILDPSGTPMLVPAQVSPASNAKKEGSGLLGPVPPSVDPMLQ